MQGDPLIEFENFQKKSQSAEKNQKGAFGLATTFGSFKNLWFSARIEPLKVVHTR